MIIYGHIWSCKAGSGHCSGFGALGAFGALGLAGLGAYGAWQMALLMAKAGGRPVPAAPAEEAPHPPA